ncbi:MAG: substrate-binding domain-containing protein [Armatimonadetes bacterium]|nr:substrate-binding domain-containing protein [Armatimonadota bacterium]
MKKLLVPLALLAVVMVATSVVKNRGNAAAGPAGSAAGPAHRDQLYVEVSALGNLDYFYDHKLGMKLAGEHFGVATEYVGPAAFDMTAMVTALEQALAKPNLKGLVVVGFEDTLIPAIDKAVAQGVPVVTVDADLPQSKRIAFVGTGNHQAGLAGGRKLAELLGGRGKVALMTKPGQSNLEERVQGYRDALADSPGITVVQVADTRSDQNVAAQAASALMEKYPDLAGIGCVEAAGGQGAATAVREAGRAGQVRIVAMDRGNEILKLIDEGVVDASVAQQTALMPYYAVQILYNLANRDVAITTDNAKAGVAGVPTLVDTGVIIVDRSNYQFYLRQ